MTTSLANFSSRPNIRGRCELYTISQDIANNRSTIGVQLWAEEMASQPTYNYGPATPWYAVGYSGGWTFDFQPGGLQSYLLLSTSFVYNHNSDGTGYISGSWNIDGDTLGTASGSIALTPPRIPRGPRVKHSGTYRNTVLYVKDAAIYRIAIPYVKSAGLYKIGGS